MPNMSIKFFLAVFMLLAVIAGCGRNSGSGEVLPDGSVVGKISASGSSALLPLLKAGQEEFYEKHEKITINISAGGSFTGQNQVVSGTVNIGNSDVALQDSLKDKDLVENLLAGIPFVFIANNDVVPDSLTAQQYSDILSGRVVNWQEIGGRDQQIIVVGRALSSGARATIRDVVLQGGKFTDAQIIQDSNGAVRAAVATTPGAIGYVDAAYSDGSVKEMAYDGVKYSVENVSEGKYPVYTFGRMFTKGQPQGAVKAFIDYLTSQEFQSQQVEKRGFIPIAKINKKG